MTEKGRFESYLIYIYVSYRFHNKIPQTRCIKQQKCVFLQFWRLQVHDQELYSVDPTWAFLCEYTSMVCLYMTKMPLKTLVS